MKAKTGKIGDDRIFIYALKEAIRIRTVEKGQAAVQVLPGVFNPHVKMTKRLELRPGLIEENLP